MSMQATAPGARYRVSSPDGLEALELEKAHVDAYAEYLHGKYGGVPSIVLVAEAATATTPSVETLDAPPPAGVRVPLVSPPSPRVEAGSIDESAKARIDVQQVQLREAGFTGIGHKATGGDGEQFYANGTRMADSGYDYHAQRKAESGKMLAREAGEALIGRVTAEQRDDVQASAREVADMVRVNGKITVGGAELTETAIRGLLARIGSPALGYVLGVRDRIASELKEDVPDVDAVQADKSRIAETLAHECRRRGDVALALRTRKVGTSGHPDIFAVTSPKYVSADAPEVVPQILAELPDYGSELRGTWNYDPESTAWELRLNVWTPTPVQEQAVGEAFEGFASMRSRDNGTGRFGGGGGVSFLRCLNASVYVSEGAHVDRVHRGRIRFDISAMLTGATKAIDTLCEMWGYARSEAVPLPVVQEKRLTIEDAIPGFWRSLLSDRRSELVSVLPGRTAEHVTGLSAAYFAERRDPERIVKADFGQAWTRYIQDQPTAVRREAETAVGDWLANRRAPIVYAAP